MLFMSCTSTHVHRALGGTVTGPDTRDGVVRAGGDADARQHGLVGHNQQMQFLSRVRAETTTAYGQKLERGTVFFLRQDFDTMENPFGFSVNDEISIRPRAGVHFIGFGPSHSTSRRCGWRRTAWSTSSDTACRGERRVHQDAGDHAPAVLACHPDGQTPQGNGKLRSLASRKQTITSQQPAESAPGGIRDNASATASRGRFTPRTA